MMDSNEINTIVRQIGITNFLGVFAVNELILIPPKTEGILIFNTEPAQENGQHWIAICINKTNVFYYDSLNSDFYLPDLGSGQQEALSQVCVLLLLLWTISQF
jgi:hypothetical protein